MKSYKLIVVLLIVSFVLALTGCAPKVVKETVVVEKQVEKIVKETVVVEKPVEKPVEKIITATPEPKGPVTITFWSAYSPNEIDVLENSVIPAFEAAHPDIKVEHVAVPYDEFRRKLVTAIAGGTVADLIRADIIWVPEFADMGALAVLDESMPDFDTYAEAVFPGPLSTNFYNGHYYGLPLDTNCRVLTYNKAMFAEAGIDAPPKTIDEFLAACEKIKTLGEGKYGFADGGTYAWAVNPWIWSFGGDVTDPGITKTSGYYNGANTVTAYEFLKKLLDDGYMHPGIVVGGLDSWGGFGKGEIAMILEGPWFPPIFEGMYPEVEYGLALMPAGKGGPISVVGGEDIVLTQQSSHKEAAAEFIRWMLSPETQLSMAETGQMPVLSELLDTEYMKTHPFYGIFLEQLKTARARTPHPAWPKMEDIMTSTGGAILSGERAVQEALDEAADQMDGLLAAQ